MIRTIWRTASTRLNPHDAARLFAAEYFDAPRGVARLTGAYDTGGGWMGMFALKGGDAEYLLRGRRDGTWEVERM